MIVHSLSAHEPEYRTTKHGISCACCTLVKCALLRYNMDSRRGVLIVSGYSEARKNANRNWDSKNLDRISVALPKGGKDALRAHAESMGETVNAFIKRAIAEVTEMDNMHRAYQRGLLRQLEKTAVALDGGDGESAKRLIAGLIEDAKADIGD